MDWNKLIDFIQETMIFFLIVVVAICILTLIAFDVLAGAGIMMYLTSNQIKESVVISLATSGLLMSLMFIGYSFSSKQKTIVKGVGAIILVLAFGVYCLDVYFDALTADYLRFGKIMVLKDLPIGDVQLLFRLLIGGISTVGETLAVVIILGMPVLKKIVSDALPNEKESNNKGTYPHPTHKSSKKAKFKSSKFRKDVFNQLPKDKDAFR